MLGRERRLAQPLESEAGAAQRGEEVVLVLDVQAEVAIDVGDHLADASAFGSIGDVGALEEVLDVQHAPGFEHAVGRSEGYLRMVRMHERLEEEHGVEGGGRIELLEAMVVAQADHHAIPEAGGVDALSRFGHLHSRDVDRGDVHAAMARQPECRPGDPTAGVEDAHAGDELGLIGDMREELAELARALRLERVAERRHVAFVPVVVVARDARRTELGLAAPAAQKGRKERAHRPSGGSLPLPAPPAPPAPAATAWRSWQQTRMPAVKAANP